MYRPVQIAPPEVMPVSLAEAKAHCRAADFDDDDATLEALIAAATAHFDGWTGTLGRVLCEQQWQQDFDAFTKCMRLPLFPVASVDSVTWRNSDGQATTVASSDYALMTDDLGAYVRFKDSYSFPSPLYQVGAIAVTFTAGDLNIPASGEDPASSGVPEPIKQAILLLVGHWYDNREAVSADMSPMPFAVTALTAPFRRPRF